MRKIFIICFTLIAGCKSTPEQYYRYNVDAKPNKVSRIANQLSLTVSKIEDSRCPEGCDCVWAGEVKVYLELNENGERLNTCLALPSHPNVQFNQYKIELKDVDPYPICHYQFPGDATVQFKVSIINKDAI